MITVEIDADLITVPEEIIDEAVAETVGDYFDLVIARARPRGRAFADYLQDESQQFVDAISFPAGPAPTGSVIGQDIARRQERRRRPTNVRAHTRRLQDGRVIPVRAHTRRSQPPIEFMRQPLPGQIWIRRRINGIPQRTGRLLPLHFDYREGVRPEVDITPAVQRLLNSIQRF